MAKHKVMIDINAVKEILRNGPKGLLLARSRNQHAPGHSWLGAVCSPRAKGKNSLAALELLLHKAEERHQLRELLSMTWGGNMCGRTNVFHQLASFSGLESVSPKLRIILEAAARLGPDKETVEIVYRASGLPSDLSGLIASFLPQPWLTQVANQYDGSSQTPVMRLRFAYRHHDEALDVAGLLVAAGADPAIRENKNQKTVLDMINEEVLDPRQAQMFPLTPEQNERRLKFIAYLESVSPNAKREAGGT